MIINGHSKTKITKKRIDEPVSFLCFLKSREKNRRVSFIYIYMCTYIQRIRSREISVLLEYVFVQPIMKKKYVRIHLLIRIKYKNRTNKETNIQEQINNQTKKKREN
jgi:hypothetical protein